MLRVLTIRVPWKSKTLEIIQALLPPIDFIDNLKLLHKRKTCYLYRLSIFISEGSSLMKQESFD